MVIRFSYNFTCIDDLIQPLYELLAYLEPMVRAMVSGKYCCSVSAEQNLKTETNIIIIIYFAQTNMI